MLIHEMFLQTAQRLPEGDALASGDTSLTYGQCATRVKCIAQELTDHLPAASKIAINTHKSIDAIVVMLACLYAGFTYVPIDPTSPIERRKFILQDCNAQALVIDNRTANDWINEQDALASLSLLIGTTSLDQSASIPTRSIVLQDFETRIEDISLSPVLDADRLAYILYTSGSTGVPKGVMITHRNAAAFVEWGSAYFDLHPGDRVAVHAPFHFDLPVFDIYVSLAQGATVMPIDEKTVLFPQAVVRFLRENSITVLYAVPSALTAIINRSTLLADGGLPSLRLLLYAGEEFHPTPLRKLMNALPAVHFFNLYGPIETNVITVYEVTTESLRYQRIPIGKPIFNTHILLLDADSQVIEDVEQEGEILVAGLSVTPGYLNRPDLTSISQVDLYYQNKLWHCYRTGDFARWDMQGTLHFLGRRDALVKTRGFRVDLGDVEATLISHPDVAEVGVVAKPHPEYSNLLYAFVVPQQGKILKESELLAWSREKLSSYMVPQQITLCQQLPKTSTGKIARKVLAEQ